MARLCACVAFSQQFPVILEKFLTKINTYFKIFLKSNKRISHIIRYLTPDRESLTFLWAVFMPDKLGSTSRTIIRDPAHLIYLSTISFWEISLKYALGKLELVNCVPDDLPEVALAMQLKFIS